LEGITIPADCDYGSSTCSTFFVLYTGWGDPTGGDYSTDAGFNEWKVKRYPFLDVTKTANTTFTRTFEWTIDKSVTPATWDLFDGDTGTSDWTVDVMKNAGTDSDWAVSGTITIENPSDLDATIESVTDAISGVGPATVDCGVTFPHLLAQGGTLVCTYDADLPDGTSRTNTATATLDTSQVFTGEADVTFGDPTTVVTDTIDVTDTNGMSWNGITDDASFTYGQTFACGANEGTHDNTATITQTGQSDDASVTVNCYDLEVTKDANPSFNRDFDWTIVKTVDPDTLDMFVGESGTVEWTVTWTKGPAVDSGHTVSGSILIENDNPTLAADLTQVVDSISPGIAATVNCPALIVPAGGSLTCTYSSDLPDDATRTNTAMATQQNHDYGSDGAPTLAGTTDYSGNASVDFAGATPTVTGDTADITDGSGVLADDTNASGSTSYTEEFTCGEDEGTHDNTAVVTADDGQTDQDTATVTVTCEEPGNVQITPTGTECEAFLDGTATDLPTLEINPAGNLAPGAFIHFAELGVSGATTIEVSVASDNPADDPPTVNETKLYSYDPATSDCTQISNQPGVTVSIVGNVAIFDLDAAAAALYPNIVTYTKYSSGSGIVGTIYTFDTSVNGVSTLIDTLEVVDNQ
jgi:hypothetical protein